MFFEICLLLMSTHSQKLDDMANFMAQKADHVIKVPVILSNAREVSFYLGTYLLGIYK